MSSNLRQCLWRQLSIRLLQKNKDDTFAADRAILDMIVNTKVTYADLVSIIKEMPDIALAQLIVACDKSAIEFRAGMNQYEMELMLRGAEENARMEETTKGIAKNSSYEEGDFTVEELMRPTDEDILRHKKREEEIASAIRQNKIDRENMAKAKMAAKDTKEDCIPDIKKGMCVNACDDCSCCD